VNKLYEFYYEMLLAAGDNLSEKKRIGVFLR